MSRPRPTRTFLDSSRKSAGIVAALLMLLLALSLGGRFFADVRDRARRVADLQALADQQQRAGQFADAWTSLEQAAEATQEGSALARLIGRGGTQRLALKTAQEDLAMAWLESWLPPAKPPPLAAALVPTLAAGAAAASGARKADLLAHLGWEAALRGGPGGEDASLAGAGIVLPPGHRRRPRESVRARVLGSLAGGQEKLGEATSRFDAALASGRARAHVRAVQLAAFLLHNRPAVGAAYIAAVADMIRNREPVDAAVRDRVYTLYAFTFDGEASFAQLTPALPPTAQIALVRTLFVDAADRAAPTAWRWRIPGWPGSRTRRATATARSPSGGRCCGLPAAGGAGPARRPGPRRGCGRPPGSVTLIDVLITFIQRNAMPKMPLLAVRPSFTARSCPAKPSSIARSSSTG